MKNPLVPIYGTQSFNHGTLVSYPKADDKVDFTIFIRRREIDPEHQSIINHVLYEHPVERTYLKHNEIKKYIGADLDEFKSALNHLESHSVEISSKSEEERYIECECSVANFEHLFKTTVGLYSGINQQQHLDHEGFLYAPENIASFITNIIGLSVEVKKESRRPTKPQAGDKRDSWEGGYSIPDLGKAYNFPEDAKGKGQSIGLIELGGKYKPADFKKYCKAIGLDKIPKVSIVGDFPESSNRMSNSEVTLDMQVIAALAPEASIVLYYAHTFIEALRLIVNDKKNKPSVISISWAATENYYHQLERTEFDTLLLEAALQGITILAASGDHGAYNRLASPEVSMPAAHPYVLGVGGTVATLDDDKLVSEVVWNEFKGRQSSGGGFSVQYQMPQYQRNSITSIYGPMRGRGVPDVAANASDIHGYQVIFENCKRIIGGTSASTPLWASLIALLNQKLKYRLGFSNAILHHLAATLAFNPVLEGNNQVYNAGPYWNPCTGLGSPNGNHLYDLINAQAEWINEQNEKQTEDN